MYALSVTWIDDGLMDEWMDKWMTNDSLIFLIIV